ncbi:MAG: L,D-transpeptidase [Thermocrispum sp.]
MTARHQKAPNGTPSAARSWRFMIGSAAAGVAAVALVIGAVMWFGGGSPDRPQPQSQAPDEQVSEKVDLAALTESSTHTTIGEAPADKRPDEHTDGTVAHPRKLTAVFDAPAGKPIAKVGPKQIGDTWLPVVDKQGDWVQVLLPSKPNGSTGWLRAGDVATSVSDHVIRVHLGSRTLELAKGDEQVGEWPVGIGKPKTPTPTGRTFLLGSLVDPNQKFSPLILPLGSHSDTLDSFGGGPGTVAIHTWPTTDVFGTESSHGCVQVPKEALDRLSEVPLGTLVLVDQK